MNTKTWEDGTFYLFHVQVSIYDGTKLFVVHMMLLQRYLVGVRMMSKVAPLLIKRFEVMVIMYFYEADLVV